jgi:hypothetical protein
MQRLLLSLLIAASSLAAADLYPNRWVFVSNNLGSDADVEAVRGIVRVASEHGLNGMVLSAGLDRLGKQSPDFIVRLRKVQAICNEHHVELIPQVFSIGYGGEIITFDRNLAEGIPVKDALFLVKGGEARISPDPPVAFVNGGLEEYSGNTAKSWRFHDQPGSVSFVDTKVFAEGKASLRFENFTANPYGHGRLMQEIAVKPHRLYRVTCQVKTENLAPSGAFNIEVLGLDDRDVAPLGFDLKPTSDWRKLTMGFNSLAAEKLRVYAGVWGGKSGKFWLDDFRIEEMGLANVLRRDGTPVTVRGDSSGVTYEEGRDYAPIQDPRLNFHFDHDGPPIRILPGSGIKDGERLRVSFYHGMAINKGQVSVCMSEPKTYQIMAEQARLLHEVLAPKKYLLSMDEIREGGSDVACQKRGMTMGQILGDCFTKEMKILRDLNPEAEIFAWSDMLDQNHNAHGNYYLVDGDFTGSWKYVPHDLRIVCWYYEKRKASLSFFSGLGFHTLAGAYYDGDTLENPQGWMEELAHTPGALGIMYTTWENKYKLLAPFGDLVSRGK